MSEGTSGQSRNSSLVKKGEHNMTEAQIKEVTDQLRQDVIAHLWRHRWMKKVVFASIVIFAVWIFSLIASIMFLAWWIKVDSGASKSLTFDQEIIFKPHRIRIEWCSRHPCIPHITPVLYQEFFQ